MKTIPVDFNRLKANGNLIASSRTLLKNNSYVQYGEKVITFQPGEDMKHYAKVVSFSVDSGKLELEVDWKTEVE